MKLNEKITNESGQEIEFLSPVETAQIFLQNAQVILQQNQDRQFTEIKELIPILDKAMDSINTFTYVDIFRLALQFYNPKNSAESVLIGRLQFQKFNDENIELEQTEKDVLINAIQELPIKKPVPQPNEASGVIPAIIKTKLIYELKEK